MDKFDLDETSVFRCFQPTPDFPLTPRCGRSIAEYSGVVSRSKHQTLKGIMDGQSKREIDLMFAEKDHDAMEWVEKRKIKKQTLRNRNTDALSPNPSDG